jgi:hypothetical protein
MLNLLTKRSPAANSVYVAIAGEVVNRSSVLQRNFVLNGLESASNPLQHIHAKRYGLVKKRHSGIKNTREPRTFKPF